MSFVKTLPEAMTMAAGQLAGIGEALATESAAALTPTTVIAPAGSDPVSQLQAALFATYGNLYQSISDQAAAVHQQLVQVLGQNAVAYSTAEQTNQATASLDAAIQGFLTDFLGVPTEGSSSLLSGNLANIGNIGMGNWVSAGSALLGLAGGGLLDFPEEAAELGGLASAETGEMAAGLGGGTVLAGAVGPAAGAAPVAAGVGQASSVGKLSVPPGWAGAGLATDTAPARLASTGWTASHAAPAAAFVPAGVPAMAAAARGASGFGAPRYGAKPTVMPKPAVV